MYHFKRLRRQSAFVRALVNALLTVTVQALQAAAKNGFDLSGILVPEDETHQGGFPGNGIPAINHPILVLSRFAPAETSKRSRCRVVQAFKQTARFFDEYGEELPGVSLWGSPGTLVTPAPKFSAMVMC